MMSFYILYNEDVNLKATKISNHSPYRVFLNSKPIPPKKKVITFGVIEPDAFAFHQGNLDMTKVYISFEEVMK